jgi:hypothetical protein
MTFELSSQVQFKQDQLHDRQRNARVAVDLVDVARCGAE